MFCEQFHQTGTIGAIVSSSILLSCFYSFFSTQDMLVIQGDVALEGLDSLYFYLVSSFFPSSSSFRYFICVFVGFLFGAVSPAGNPAWIMYFSCLEIPLGSFHDTHLSFSPFVSPAVL